MNAQQIQGLFQQFKADNPTPAIELNFTTPFELLVAVILSARATDVSVNKATVHLFKVANTPETLLALGEEGLKPYINKIGLFNAKGKNILKTCQILIDQHQSQVPNTREALEALPGVGRKSANVILNTVFGEPTIAVDTHIFRVSNRMGLAPGKTVFAVEKKLSEIIPDEFKLEAHHWLVLHGRYVCTARKPKCGACTVENFCGYEQKS